MNKDTFSRNVKEDLCQKKIESKTQAFWEAYALGRFLKKTGSDAETTVWAEPYLMRRFILLSKHTQTSWNTKRFFGRKGRAGFRVNNSPVKVQYELILKHPFLRRPYLRGVFLAKGSLLSPYRGHHLEIALTDKKDADFVKSLLESEGLKAGLAKRRSRHVVYMKDADNICEFLKALGSSRALLEYENIRVSKSLKNSVQRMVNMDRANVSRTVEASLKQIEDIQLLEEARGLNKIPRALKTLALARLENPEMSMGELGQQMSPPISKSAVNHRFRRIAKMAEKIREKDISRGAP